MKKIFAVILFLSLGLALQSCGGAEKCPAYSSIESAPEAEG
jgi:hypothetical protein